MASQNRWWTGALTSSAAFQVSDQTAAGIAEAGRVGSIAIFRSAQLPEFARTRIWARVSSRPAGLATPKMSAQGGGQQHRQQAELVRVPCDYGGHRLSGGKGGAVQQASL